MGTITIRNYISGDATDFDGTDEGGKFKLIEVEQAPKNLKRRMERCGGCRNEFYNNRANTTGNHCWSLTDADSFRGRGLPKCHNFYAQSKG